VYDDVFTTVARFAAPSPCHDDDLLGAFGIFIPDREALNGKATAHNRFDTAPRMESESESEFLTSLAAQASSAEEAMVTTADAGSPARLNPRYPCLPEGAVLFHRDPDEKVIIDGTELSGEVHRLCFSLSSPDQAMNPATRSQRRSAGPCSSSSWKRGTCDCVRTCVGVDVPVAHSELKVFDQMLSPCFDGEPIFVEDPNYSIPDFVNISCHDNDSVQGLQLERLDLAGRASDLGTLAVLPGLHTLRISDNVRSGAFSNISTLAVLNMSAEVMGLSESGNGGNEHPQEVTKPSTAWCASISAGGVHRPASTMSGLHARASRFAQPPPM
jgi:hypothetical protein